ncbi:hypothetical protein FNV43_RR10887 [Rhamnella rubrinervis]|uniref:Uncharacterized protein n=1 Tax=Rhamnella rubrinervis TaxID=2594499 RepID=A0A8K0H4J3_9ROSA|nr:hypothetical protein FNV43_RR10887 [Rhamnella rubrinervis]
MAGMTISGHSVCRWNYKINTPGFYALKFTLYGQKRIGYAAAKRRVMPPKRGATSEPTVKFSGGEYPRSANPLECNAPAAVGDSKANEYRGRHEFDGSRDAAKFGLGLPISAAHGKDSRGAVATTRELRPESETTTWCAFHKKRTHF